MIRRTAFSLVELLVVIGVLGILVGLTLPAVSNARAGAARLACQNNLRQLGIALHWSHERHGSLPPRATRRTPPRATRRTPPRDPNRLLGWMALILPEVEQRPAYDAAVAACAVEPDVLKNPPHTTLTHVVKIYTCPVDNRLGVPLTDDFGVTAAFASYIGVGASIVDGAKSSQDGVLGFPEGVTFAQVTDGLSNTILVVERPPPDSRQAGWWYSGFYGHGPDFGGPNNGLILGGGTDTMGDPCVLTGRAFGPGQRDNPCDRFHIWSLHPGGANFLFCDGSVRYLTHAAESAVRETATRAGGETIDWP